ncbi:MAG: hypothetical protein O7G84_01040 [Gammaproteobacteria bacterium]|nr:hypothetical protein [Gammaproteobacteria bacterium]
MVEFRKIVRNGIVDEDGYGGFVISEVSGEPEGDFDDGPCEALEPPSYGILRDSDGGFVMHPVTEVDPDRWDDGSGELAKVPVGLWQVVLVFPLAPRGFRYVHGQTLYAKAEYAESAYREGERPVTWVGMTAVREYFAYAIRQGAKLLDTGCVLLGEGRL